MMTAGVNDKINVYSNLFLLLNEISKPQLCRIFKKATGTNMGQYITVKRLVTARKLLHDGAKPTTVYSECGFGNYSTFYRAYVKNFGEALSEKHNK